MVVLQSLGALADVGTASTWSPSSSYGSLTFYNRYAYDYATIYKTQPNVRTCVDFLARNIAQLGLHVFQRVGETDRQRLRDHPLAQLLARPLPPEFKLTRYKLIESLVADLGIYFNAYWLKLRVASGAMGLLPIPPVYMTVYGTLYPTRYEINVGTWRKTFQPAEIVHFRGYNPENPAFGLSPMETLRRILAEEHAMGEYREYFWRNSARMNGVIERPADAPEWTQTARERFKAEFEALYAGDENSGKTAILEEGMTWKEASFNAQESEYLGGKKLTREECARAYHIPPPMVGILDHATFSNIKEQHKNLYQDCLGPWLAMIEEEIALQLTTDFESGNDVYCEFNIQEKLQGSFEEQTAAYQSAVGAPYMTRNEARARQNLPSVEGGDELVTPLNVLVGGQASPRDSAPDAERGQAAHTAPDTKAARINPTHVELRQRHIQKWEQVIRHHFERQRQAILGRVPEKSAKAIALGELWDPQRWNRELHADLFRLNVATATVWARSMTEQLGAELDEERMYEWLDENARIAAENINDKTGRDIEAALAEEEPRSAVRHLFEIAVTVRALQIATSKVTTAANFGSREGARQGGLRSKTWIVNSSNPRPEHAAMNGETVGIDELFSNGMMWPGDPAGGGDNNADCQCSLAFGR